MRRVLSVILVLTYGVSFACTCAAWKTVSQRRDSHPVTVHARILASGPDPNRNPSARKFTVAVIRDYSAFPLLSGDTAYFWSNAVGTTCDFQLPSGQEAILFGDTAGFAQTFGITRPDRIYSTSFCSQNVIGPELGNALEELAGGVPVRPFPASEKGHGPGKQIILVTRVLFGGRFGADGRCAPERPPAGPVR